MKYKKYILLQDFGTNTYLLWDEKSKEGILIDPAYKSEKLAKEIEALGIDLKMIVNTHGHADHIGGNEFFSKKFDIPIAINKNDAFMLLDSKANLSTFYNRDFTTPKAQKFLEDNDILQLGEEKIRIILTPGHTQGGICLLVGNLLFSGDTLFQESIGRTDLPGGNHQQLLNSIKEKLFKIDDDTIVLPGHGEQSMIGDEKVGNPFVGLAARL